MSAKPYFLSHLTLADVRATRWNMAVLPFGATEPHNLHLPYGIDCFQVEAIADGACAHAWKLGAKALLLPTIPVGVNTNYFKVPGAMALSFNPSTLLAIIRDITDSLARQGIDRLLLLNGHGGNELKPLTRELHADSKVFTVVCDWFRMGADLVQEIMELPGEHADETETSLAMALVPDLVQFEKADKGALAKSPIEAINKGWFSITRPWHLLTTNTGAGDPSKSSAEKGRRLLDGLVERLGGAIHQMATAPRSERFPYA